MSKPADLQMREYNVCMECMNRVGSVCRRRQSPIRWSFTRYGCGEFRPRDYLGVEE